MGPVDNLTVRQGVDLWMNPDGSFNGELVSPDWESSRRSYLKDLVAAVGDCPFAEFGPVEMWRVQRYCRDKGLKNTTANKVTHTTLGALLAFLEAIGRVPIGTHDRIIHCVKRQAPDGERRGVALTREERDQVIAAFDGTYASPVVYLGFFTGMRGGEMSALRQRDLHWSRHLINVAHSRTRKRVSTGKSKPREFRAPLVVFSALAPLRRSDAPDELVLRSPTGRPFSMPHFREDLWRPTVARAGFPDLHPHDMRHTFATHLLERGESIAVVAKRLGDTKEMVLERYEHALAMGSIDEMMQAPAKLRAVK